MISKQYKFIFVAIPKCAGTSIRKIVEPYSELNNFKTIYGEDYGEGFKGKVLRKIFRPQKYFKTIVTNPASHMDLVKKITQPDYFMFTFVRNPYDRSVSLWKYLHPKLSFNQFIDWLEDDDLKKSFHDLAHVKSCSFYLELYQEIFHSNHYIGHVENINNDFKHICDRLGLPSLKVPQLKKTQHFNYRSYYNQDSIDRIKRIYHRDFELFNYRF